MGEGDGVVGEDDGGVGVDRGDDDGPRWDSGATGRGGGGAPLLILLPCSSPYMGVGVPPWSLAPMAWEGREPLRDWIYLFVSLCFCVLRFCPFTVSFRSGDPYWGEYFAQILLINLDFLQQKKSVIRLRGARRVQGAAPSLIAPSGTVSRRFFLPKITNIPK